MGILELAKNMEQQGIEYYNKLASEAPIAELKGVFEFLAKEEENHYDVFASCACANGGSTAKSNLLTSAQKTFSELAKNFNVPETTYDYEAAYRKALSMENDTIEYYVELKEKLSDNQQKELIDFVIEQEKSHVRLLEALLEFVRNPKVWLENAEWEHLDSY